jgi:hypothetical protein
VPKVSDVEVCRRELGQSWRDRRSWRRIGDEFVMIGQGIWRRLRRGIGLV